MASKLRILDFDSFDAFVAQAEKKGCWKTARSRESGPWFGTDNMEHAVQLARTGWPDGRAKIVQGLSEASSIRRPSHRRAQDYDVAGTFPDVARFVAGAPDCMVSLGDNVVARKPIVPIYINPCWSGSTDTALVINRGVALLSYIDVLEDAGYSCEISATYRVTSGPYDFRINFPMKRAGEPLELDRLVFSLANPSILRRLIFSLYEQIPEFEAPFYPGYGSVQDIPEKERDPGTVYIPSIYGHDARWISMESAITAMQSILHGVLAPIDNAENAEKGEMYQGA